MLSKNLPTSRRPVSKVTFESVPRGGSYLPVMAWLGRGLSRRAGRGGLSVLFRSLFFYAALFQEKRAWTAGEIVQRAAKGKEAGGRGLSRAQVFRNLRELEAKSRLKKTGNRPLTEYRAAEGFSARRAESAARRDDSPETIEIEGGPTENEAVAAA